LSLIVQGLVISILGLLLTFLALGLLILTMVLLQRLFSPAPSGTTVKSAGEGPPGSNRPEELVAVIATALAVARARQPNAARLGENLRNSPGHWWQSPESKLPALSEHASDGRTRA
jgi:Na+-transporting methylmalonyl-CoA/oxaloacetate decarboxylase gamma subunit